jgi:hypothetical protein
MSPVIEVIIGIILVYLILSLIGSAVNEGVAAMFGRRARYLEKGIQSIIGPSFGADFFKHGLIQALSNSEAKLSRYRRLPSYISASRFTSTVLDLIEDHTPAPSADQSEPDWTPEHPPAMPPDATAVAKARTAKSVSDAVAEAASLPHATDATAAAAGTAVLASKDASELEALAHKFEAIPDGRIPPAFKGAFRVLVKEAASVQDLRTKIESWYDETMERVGGWYKRYTKLWLFVIGLMLAIMVNADTLNVSISLWRNPTLRSAATTAAENIVKSEKVPSAQDAVDQLKNLEQLQLPLGWRFKPRNATPAALGRYLADPRRFPENPWNIVLKLVGLLITAIALSFGAQFWFDLLGKFVNLKSSGALTQTAQAGTPAATTSS